MSTIRRNNLTETPININDRRLSNLPTVINYFTTI